MAQYDEERHKRLRAKKSTAYKTGNVTLYRNAILPECYDFVIKRKDEFYDVLLDINVQSNKPNCYYELCLESEKRNYKQKDFSVIIGTEVFDFLLPIITAVNPNFCDTGNRTFDDFKWVEMNARFRSLSENLRSAKQLEDISYYIFSLGYVVDVEFIFLDFERFCDQFAQYLDDLAAWIDEALTKGEDVWIMGL